MHHSTMKEPEASAVPTVELRIVQDNGFRTTKLITEGRMFMVGSAAHHGLRLDAAGVDQTHCMIALRNGEVHIRDWNSSQGTFLNGRQLEAEAIAHAGDVIRIGECRIEIPMTQTVCIDPPTEPELDMLGDLAPKKEPGTALDFDSAIDIMLNGLPEPELQPNPEPMPHVEANAEAPPQREDPVELLEEVPTVHGNESQWQTAGLSGDEWFDEFEFAAATEADKAEASDSLQSEIEFLRRELADRDARLREMEALAFGTDTVGDDAEEQDSAVAQAVTRRLEQVLDELEKADERSATLTDMLTRSEEANRAAEEERNQIETWVGEIERLFSAKESEWQAEREVLSRRIDQISQQRDDLERKLESAARGGQAAVAAQYVQSIRRELAEAQQELAAVTTERDKLAAQAGEHAGEQIEKRVREQIEAELREERLILAEERAELARLRAEGPKATTAAAPKNDPRAADYKIRAFREHLRELHETDPPPVRQGNVSQRLGKLWRKLNGTPLDTD